MAVIGLSSFGFYLCRYLTDIGTEVLALDIKEDRIDDVKSFVKRAIVGDAKDKATLARLGLDEFDAVVVSVGEHLDASILITMYLRELGVKEIVAKALTEDHAKILNMIGASTIVFPERDMAKRIAQTLGHTSLLDYIALGEEYGIIEMAPPRSWIGKSLAELQIRNNYNAQVVMIKELVPENTTIIPGGSHVVKDSDILVVIGANEDLEKLDKIDKS
ncbi:MAG: TrkA family potassium uptake protein [Calditrichaeota bacterium]|nr:MAG: TrkA family potassium uptake protein [Calditrichota bacterium]